MQSASRDAMEPILAVPRRPGVCRGQIYRPGSTGRRRGGQEGPQKRHLPDDARLSTTPPSRCGGRLLNLPPRPGTTHRHSVETLPANPRWTFGYPHIIPEGWAAAPQRKLRGAGAGGLAAPLEPEALRASHWAGMIPKVSCIVALPMHGTSMRRVEDCDARGLRKADYAMPLQVSEHILDARRSSLGTSGGRSSWQALLRVDRGVRQNGPEVRGRGVPANSPALAPQSLELGEHRRHRDHLMSNFSSAASEGAGCTDVRLNRSSGMPIRAKFGATPPSWGFGAVFHTRPL